MFDYAVARIVGHREDETGLMQHNCQLCSPKQREAPLCKSHFLVVLGNGIMDRHDNPGRAEERKESISGWKKKDVKRIVSDRPSHAPNIQQTSPA
jgi:hypothetical protein